MSGGPVVGVKLLDARAYLLDEDVFQLIYHLG